MPVPPVPEGESGARSLRGGHEERRDRSRTGGRVRAAVPAWQRRCRCPVALPVPGGSAGTVWVRLRVGAGADTGLCPSPAAAAAAPATPARRDRYLRREGRGSVLWAWLPDVPAN